MQGCLSSVLGISEGKALAHDKIFRALFGRKIQLLVPESSVLDKGTMFHTPELPYFEERPVISHDSSLYPTHQGMLLGFFQNPDPRKPSVSRKLYHTHLK